MAIDIEAIKARAEAATAAPWISPVRPKTLGGHDHYICQVGEFFVVDETDGGPPDMALADAVFIAHARTDVPALVAEIERLRDERDDLIRTLCGIPAGPSPKDVENAYYAGRDSA